MKTTEPVWECDFSSIAFLEVTANELFGDAVDAFETDQLKQLAPDARKAMATSREQGVSDRP